MSQVDVTTIDLSLYQSSPMLPAEGTLTLGLDLHHAMPEEAPTHVKKAGKRMLTTANEVKQALISKVEDAGIALGTLVEFDIFSDRIWHASKRRLDYWTTYSLPGVDMLSEDEQDEIDLDDKREKAETARELYNHLFGEDGLAFLRKPFNQQVALMASRLSFIAASDKIAQYEEVLGAELLVALNVVQGRYQAMVHDRAMRDDSSANLRTLRQTLQRHIALYCNAVITMLDEDDPDSVDVVLTALRPMVNARVRRPRTAADADADQAVPLEAEAEAEAPPAPGRGACPGSTTPRSSRRWPRSGSTRRSTCTWAAQDSTRCACSSTASRRPRERVDRRSRTRLDATARAP